MAISCETLAANPSLVQGENLVLDLDGGPACTLPDSTDLVVGGAGTQLLAENGTLEVRGNIRLSGTSSFTVRTGTLRLDNQTNFEHGVSASDSASWILDHATLATNATGMNNVSAVYTGSGTASAQFQSANLDSTANWLLATNTENSSLYAGNSNVPNEIYLQDSASVEIEDDQVPDHPRSNNGLWLRFFDGGSATIALPDESGPYSWQAGRGQSGYTNVDWYLEVVTASPGIGIETHAGSSVEIDGRGAAAKEVGFGIYIDPAAGSAIADALASTPFAFSNPPLNLVADYTLPTLPGAAASQLTLHDVNVGALAWQVYVGGGAGAPPVTVNLGAGAFNEVAAFAGGTLNLNGSTTQLAVVEAAGPGAQVNAAGADLWSQTIQADSTGQVALTHSTVHGSSLVATNGGLLALDAATALWADGESTPPDCDLADTYAWMLAHGGTPECNPYSDPGQLSTRTIAGAGSVLDLANSNPACPWVGNSYLPALEFEAGPTVSAASPGSLTCTSGGGAVFTGTLTAYPFLLEGVQASQVYTCTITAGASQMSYSATAPSCTP